jgi:hypothetical protein
LLEMIRSLLNFIQVELKCMYREVVNSCDSIFFLWKCLLTLDLQIVPENETVFSTRPAYSILDLWDLCGICSETVVSPVVMINMFCRDNPVILK